MSHSDGDNITDADAESEGRTLGSAGQSSLLPTAAHRNRPSATLPGHADGTSSSMRIPLDTSSSVSDGESRPVGDDSAADGEGDTTTQTSSIVAASVAGHSPTAALLIIGSQILDGSVSDANAPFLCRELYKIGVAVEKVVFLPDDVTAISEEVKAVTGRYTYVFTTGGVGCTHDDCTMEAISRAFGDKLVVHAELYNVLRKNLDSGLKRTPSPVTEQGTSRAPPLSSTPRSLSSSLLPPASEQSLTTNLIRMATIPSSSILLYPPSITSPSSQPSSPIASPSPPYPLLSTHNVYSLPGPPLAVASQFPKFVEYFRSHRPFARRVLLLGRSEADLAATVDELAWRFGRRGVSVGVHEIADASPLGDLVASSRGSPITRVTIVGKDPSLVRAARDGLVSAVPPDWILSEDEEALGAGQSTLPSSNPPTESRNSTASGTDDLLTVFRRLNFEAIHARHVRECVSDSPISEKLAKSLRIVEEAAEKYGPQGLALSFNGGKDCTVLLHLFASALWSWEQKHGPVPVSTSPIDNGRRGWPMKTIYVTHRHQFAEVDEFVEECEQNYGLRALRIEGSMKPALQTYLSTDTDVKAVLVGTRRTDPFGEFLRPFHPTDPGWPTVMRVHPVLDWSYDDIWTYLRDFEVPYCTLYDAGYTSLGSTDTTFPNPQLRNPASPSGYDPAWKLADGSKERDGRAPSKPQTPAKPQPEQSASPLSDGRYRAHSSDSDKFAVKAKVTVVESVAGAAGEGVTREVERVLEVLMDGMSGRSRGESGLSS